MHPVLRSCVFVGLAFGGERRLVRPRLVLGLRYCFSRKFLGLDGG